MVTVCLSDVTGSDSEDNVSAGGDVDDDELVADGPPPLKSDDHYHVFFYHSANSEDQDQIEHYMSMIENRSVFYCGQWLLEHAIFFPGLFLFIFSDLLIYGGFEVGVLGLES